MDHDEAQLGWELDRLAGAVGQGGPAMVAGFLPTVEKSHAELLALSLSGCEETVLAAFRRRSRHPLVRRPEPGVVQISGVLGAGCFALNPTIVRVRLTMRHEASTLVSVTAKAKEGLIPQRTAASAINYLFRRLRRLASP
ncbi:hypothetical protein [Actinomycetospora soli]|uniref:hypothetical protein n=1 Tax=Actinomycetospora soli TaxID=2893887 RepID=UPI001E4C0366|nr:hypothetical protein [Actinomycetospora soli]MCD2191253.1 hypothetical protein [Actinomycetospora soli]